MPGHRPPVGVLACWVAALSLGAAALVLTGGPAPAPPSLTAAVSPTLPGADPGRLPGLLDALTAGRRSPRVIAVYGSGVAGRWSYSLIVRGSGAVLAADLPGASAAARAAGPASGWTLPEFDQALAVLAQDLGGWGLTGLLDGTRAGVLTACRAGTPGGGARCATVRVPGARVPSAGPARVATAGSAARRGWAGAAGGRQPVASSSWATGPAGHRVPRPVTLRITPPCGWLAVAETGGGALDAPGPELGELGGVGDRSISGAGYCGALAVSLATSGG